MGTRGNKGQQKKLTEQEQEDHARDERLPKLVLAFIIVYSSS